MSYAGLGDLSSFTDSMIRDGAARMAEGAAPILAERIRDEIPGMIQTASPYLRQMLTATLADTAIQSTIGASKREAALALFIAALGGSVLTWYLVKYA